VKRKICLASTVFVLLVSNNCLASVNLGSTNWYESQEASRLSINGSGQVVWDPYHDRTVYVYLGQEYSLANVGDSVTFSCLWSSSGDQLQGCLDYGCENEDRCNFDDDVTCLAGTGDFRIGLLDSNNRGIITSDAFETCGENPIFRGYLGYQWRFHPHICQGERFTQSTGESHTNVSMWKRDDPFLSVECGANLMGDCGGVCSRPKDPRPFSRKYGPEPACFDLELGGWAPLSFAVEKVSNGLRTTFSFNGQTYSYTDTSESYQPDGIDVFAVHFSNARPYDYVKFDSIAINGQDVNACNLAGDLNNDCVVNWADLKVVADNWLGRCRYGNECGDITGDYRVNMLDYQTLAGNWFEAVE